MEIPYYIFQGKLAKERLKQCPEKWGFPYPSVNVTNNGILCLTKPIQRPAAAREAILIHSPGVGCNLPEQPASRIRPAGTGGLTDPFYG